MHQIHIENGTRSTMNKNVSYGMPKTGPHCLLVVKIGIFAVVFGILIIITTYYHGTLSESVLDRKSRGISDKYTNLVLNEKEIQVSSQTEY